VSDTKLSVSSLDAAFDILANDTFSKLDHLVRKFEAATSIQLDDGIAKGRWEEACKRYWVTKAMEDLCCVGTRPSTESDTDGGDGEYTSVSTLAHNSSRRRRAAVACFNSPRPRCEA
jgi:hypothetical protein